MIKLDIIHNICIVIINGVSREGDTFKQAFEAHGVTI